MYKETPLIKQYYNLKKKYNNTILFFQVGEFYEIFGYDAIICSRILDITLTKRNKKNSNSIFLVGFPCKSLNIYLKKLIKYGYKVAICDQIKNNKNKKLINKKEKKLIDREITDIITPGISIYDDISKKKNSKKFISSIYFKKNKIGISFIDFSTGDFLTTEGDLNYIKHIINCLKPKEFYIQKSKKKIFNLNFNKNNKFIITLLDDNYFNYKILYSKLLEHFNLFSLNCFGIENMNLSIISSGILIYYIKNYYNLKLNHINNIKIIKINKYVWIDDSTIKHLEILKNKNKKGQSLLSILDNTYTAMGYRLLNNWIIFPLIEKKNIYNRQKIISFFFKTNDKLQLNLSLNLKYIYDIDKLISKISNYKINPNQFYKFTLSIKKIINIINILNIKKNYKIFNFKKKYINNIKYIYKKIDNFVINNYVNKFNKEFFIKKNISNKIDNYKKKLKKKKKYILKYYNNKKKKLKFSYFKIKNNDLLETFLEIKKKDINLIPKNWIKKQNLSLYIRYTTKLINNYDYKIYNIKKKIFFYEKLIFDKKIDFLNKNIFFLKKISDWIAKIDVLFSFFFIAKINNYTKPKIINNKKKIIKIIKGRHPVIEKNMSLTNNYIPNDIYLDNFNNQILIITGPNMSGKSAILRQTALIIIMAQIGSYVPAKLVEFNIIDKIFSRIGASDNISIGESTFMVEMNETSNILNNFTKNSLIIMDEIGRGTSIFDGISLSYSIIKYLIKNKFKPKVLFATHFHELQFLLKNYNNIKYYYLSIKKINNNIIFIRKLKDGINNNSYGIYIAKMSGIPKKIIYDSKKIYFFLKKKNLINLLFYKFLSLLYIIKNLFKKKILR
ncbi:MAG: DNA mismatch repair protein MutS [Candidatus Shikimatogenerans bostrichidophilus]|nr:MAG: DNA mismatch repair protein MutS [Candidatus Shikimatogenerans bostrichidophilus]